MRTCAIQFCTPEKDKWVPNHKKTYFYNFPDNYASIGSIYRIATNIEYKSPVYIVDVLPAAIDFTVDGTPIKNVSEIREVIFNVGENNYQPWSNIIKNTSTTKTVHINKKEENDMKNSLTNFEFGKVPNGIFKMSIMGLAFNLGDNRYGVYNMEENEFTDVTEATFDMNDMIYQIPIAIKNIAVGDIIKHKNKYVIVKEGNASGSITVIDPIDRTEINIIPTKNMFGFNFVTKVVNLFENMISVAEYNKPSEDNPFGNIMPFVMMSSFFNKNKNSDDNEDFVKTMMLFQMMGNKDSNFDFSKNPFMALAFMK